MAEWREFDATNEPGTCLWCGRALRWKRTTLDKPAGVEWEDWWPQLRALPKAERTEPVYDKPGDYGDGFFCGLRCAHSFAAALAQHGRRLGPKEGA